MKTICPFCQATLTSYDLGSLNSNSLTLTSYCCSFCSIYSYSRTNFEIHQSTNEVVYFSFIISHENNYYMLASDKFIEMTSLFLLTNEDQLNLTFLIKIKKFYKLPDDNILSFLESVLIKIKNYVPFK